MKSKLLVRLIVSVCFCLSFVVSVSSQSPLWIYGNKLIHFSETGITTSNLPQPGVDLDLHYTGQIPTRGQNCQFDNQGNLLFFIIDGNIYDRDGYIIAPYSEFAIENGHPIMSCYSDDIAITNVPGHCNKFYLFYTVQYEQGSSITYGYCSILDLDAQNPFFPNIPSRKGTLVNGDFQTDVDDPFYYFFEANSSNNNGTPPTYARRLTGINNSTKSFNLFEVLELSENHKIVIIGSRNDGFVFCELTPGNITIDSNCSIEGEDTEETYYGSLKSVALAGGVYRIASQSVCNQGQTSEGNLPFFVHNFSFPAGIASTTEFEINSDPNDQIIAFEFSPDGNNLWFTKLHEPQIGVCNLNTGLVSFPLSTSSLPPSIDLSEFAFSEMEGQKDESGAEVIYLSSASGLYKLSSPNNPNTSTITTVSWAIGIPPCSAEVNNIYNINSIYTLQPQNTGTPIIQDYLAGSSCCHDYVVIHDDAPTQINTSIDGNWYNGQNPFQNQSSPIKIVNDLVFQTGTVTHIYNMTFEFDVNADVIIQKGASVYLHGTTWTSLDCENIMWPGVDLLGTTNAANSIDQLPVSGGDQGYLNLSNSVIENAMIGIDVGGNFPNNAGGIVRASQSTFRNNYNDVIFKKYRFEIGGDPVQNKSYFNLCTFITDEHLNNPSLSPNNHVLLKSVDKISFKNCSFMNKTDINTYNWFNRGTGIYSSRASFTVDGSNDTWSGSPVDSEQTTFYKLQYGIRSAGFNDPDAFYTCKEQEFQYCLYGIVNYNTDNVLIYLNNFVLPDAAGFNSNETVERGIYLTNSTGYVVEQNTFDGFDDFQVNDEFPCALGIWVDNSGDAANEIRNNDFNEMKLGTYITRNNKNMVIGPDSANADYDIGFEQTGLQLICNTYTNGQTDIFRDAQTLIRQDQGGIQPMPLGFLNAGNRFSAPDCEGAVSDFVIDPDNVFYNNYWCYDQPNTIPDCGGICGVAGVNQDMDLLINNIAFGMDYDDSDCPNKFGSPIVNSPNPVLISGFMLQLDSVRVQLQVAKSTYKLVVDHNMKQNTLDVLTEAFPHESQYYRDLLMQRFPLSSEVMRELIKQSTRLSPWHLTEVLLANSPLSKDLLFEIDRAQILSPFFMNFLQNANSGTSLKRVMELNILNLATERDYLLQSIAHAGLSYESNAEIDLDQAIHSSDYITQMAFQKGASACRIVAAQLASEGDYEYAISLVSTDSLLSSYHRILQMEQSVNGDWSLLNEVQKNILFEISALKKDYGNSLALSILHELGLGNQEPEPNFPIQYRSLKTRSNDYENENKLLGVWPNPASGSVWLTYPNEADGLGSVEIYDMQGRLINKFTPSSNGLVKIQLSNYSNGVYVVRLIAFEKEIDNVKLTVIEGK
jgi:hypothetical protein